MKQGEVTLYTKVEQNLIPGTNGLWLGDSTRLPKEHECGRKVLLSRTESLSGRKKEKLILERGWILMSREREKRKLMMGRGIGYLEKEKLMSERGKLMRVKLIMRNWKLRWKWAVAVAKRKLKIKG